MLADVCFRADHLVLVAAVGQALAAGPPVGEYSASRGHCRLQCSGLPGGLVLAARTTESVRPPQATQILSARRLCGEPLLEFQLRPRILLHGLLLYMYTREG